MKSSFSLSFGLLLAAAAPGLRAGEVSMPWFTQDTGGGASVAAPYRLGGTAGQCDAGSSSGGSYTLVAGFWGGAYGGPMPIPSITTVNGKVRITWPSWATSFKLLGRPDLSPGSVWTLAPYLPVLEDDHYLVEIPPGQAKSFYQLWLP